MFLSSQWPSLLSPTLTIHQEPIPCGTYHNCPKNASGTTILSRKPWLSLWCFNKAEIRGWCGTVGRALLWGDCEDSSWVLQASKEVLWSRLAKSTWEKTKPSDSLFKLPPLLHTHTHTDRGQTKRGGRGRERRKGEGEREIYKTSLREWRSLEAW